MLPGVWHSQTDTAAEEKQPQNHFITWMNYVRESASWYINSAGINYQKLYPSRLSNPTHTAPHHNSRLPSAYVVRHNFIWGKSGYNFSFPHLMFALPVRPQLVYFFFFVLLLYYARRTRAASGFQNTPSGMMQYNRLARQDDPLAEFNCE